MSTTASQYAGFNVKLNQILAMVVSGAVAGILGAMVYCGRDLGAIAITPISKTIPQEGFNGISVGLIAMNNP
jgi:simple sugar transport system permease protein